LCATVFAHIVLSQRAQWARKKDKDKDIDIYIDTVLDKHKHARALPSSDVPSHILPGHPPQTLPGCAATPLPGLHHLPADQLDLSRERRRQRHLHRLQTGGGRSSAGRSLSAALHEPFHCCPHRLSKNAWRKVDRVPRNLPWRPKCCCQGADT